MSTSLFQTSAITNEYEVVHGTQETVLSDTFSLYSREGQQVTAEGTWTVRFIAKTHYGAQTDYISVAGAVSDGDVSISVPSTSLITAGIFNAELQVQNAAGAYLYRFPMFLNIEQGLNVNSTDREKTTVRSVRGHLQDRMAEDNPLLGMEEFLDGEICRAAFRAVDMYNSLPPTTMTKYSPSTFPEQMLVLEGTCAYAMLSTGMRLMRNRSVAEGSGISLDMEKRGEVYLQLADSMLKSFRGNIANFKNAKNMSNGYGSALFRY